MTEEKEKKDPLARTLGILGLIVAIASAVLSYMSYLHSVESEKRSGRSEARSLLDEALDLMGNKKNSAAIYLNNNVDLSEEESARFEHARRNIEKALDISPDFYIGHEYKGLYFERLNRLQDAEASLKRSINLLEKEGVEDWWPYSDLANVMLNQNMPIKALKLYEKAIKVDQFDPSLHRNIAIYYEAINESDMAQTHWCLSKKYLHYGDGPLQFPDNLKCR